MTFADQLLLEIGASDVWPLKRERHVQQQIHVRRAFRKGDKRTLEAIANWDVRCHDLFVGDTTRPYVHDPLAKRIADAWADFLFGDPPTITAHNAHDQLWLDWVVSQNRLPSQLHRAEAVVASEGETWWHIWTDRGTAGVPLVQFTSRTCVVPMFRGDSCIAAAFVSVIAEEEDVVWRLVSSHARGILVNALFRGVRNQPGERVKLTERPEVADLPEAWLHGLPMLAGRVVNQLDDDPCLGIGEYDQIQDLLLALNEARTIGAENTRLTAKKRLFVHGSLTEPDGSFDAGQDVIQVDSQGGVLGEGEGHSPVTEVEYGYDAAPLIAHTQDLERTILSRVGLVPQMVGHAVEGQAESGTAIRLRFLPTEIAADGKAREWQDLLPHIVQLLTLVDRLPERAGGFGSTYIEAGAPPTVVLGSILPVDDSETVTDNGVAVTAGIRSRETAVRAQHPDWTDQDVSDELDRIKVDEQLMPDVPPPPPAPDLMADAERVRQQQTNQEAEAA